ncbi:fumarylacetoacetase [Phycicoccus endophyticus]|uniref:fumarylacetoacetase n=1 Tax=Phycicoccus endophyticus TaxID=1690220 RepID=A0A7G9R3A4_9MICO|nr:fumarylacetoacetase [Phycicoccus endophyticus]NHI19826.1 fumarylacetoacetase [Phycicoccus endophyticus]QNN50079.1 fumarylacetoacetase [Phycicoccus endophyticus]GGL28275.1 fumarylacetoacetase [Phycicoccus endophyticus]
MSWLGLPAEHPFGVDNLPYGVFSTGGGPRRVGVRVGEHVLDLAACAERAGMESAAVWRAGSLDAFLAEGARAWTAAREWLLEQLTSAAHRDAVEPYLVPLEQVAMHLPFSVADYVDFYASEHHASNVGRIFRPDGEPLPPSWRHLPVGYHGRAGTVVVSGTDVVRPVGQRRAPTETAPTLGPSTRLDLEAELGFVVGGGTELGRRVDLAEADDHLFGTVLLNDWSARDLQAWEYVPLGPFLGKSFATSISPWVVTTDALRAARVPLPRQHPAPLPYLRGEAAYGLEVHLEVECNGTVVSRPEYRDMYWSPVQMLTHLTVNGASLRPGDLFGSGTVSGPDPGSRGSLLELTWSGQEPLTLADGSTRTFLEDGDTVTLRATAPGPDGAVIGFGACTGTVRPAR